MCWNKRQSSVYFFVMRDRLTLCFSAACEDQFSCYQSPEDAKKAKLRNRQISKVLKQHQKEELKKLKILLLGKFLFFFFFTTVFFKRTIQLGSYVLFHKECICLMMKDNHFSILICIISKRYRRVWKEHFNKTNEDHSHKRIWHEVKDNFLNLVINLLYLWWIFIPLTNVLDNKNNFLFDYYYRERLEKVSDIRKNIKESIVVSVKIEY